MVEPRTRFLSISSMLGRSYELDRSVIENMLLEWVRWPTRAIVWHMGTLHSRRLLNFEPLDGLTGLG